MSNRMKYQACPPLGRSLARVIFGGATLVNHRDHFRLLDAAYDLGANTFETARTYSGGDSEVCLGMWCRLRQLSDRVTIITKGGHPFGGRHRITYTDLLTDIHASLHALRRDRLDFFLLHRDDPQTCPEDTIEILNELKAEGLIDVFGVSNWTSARIELAQTHARARGLTMLCASSPHLSLAEWNCAPWEGCRSLAGPSNALDCTWYEMHSLPVLAWSSLAGGFFSGPTSTADTGEETLAQALTMKVYYSRANLQRLDRARMLAERLAVSPTQIALAYVLGRFPQVHAIVGCSTSSHFRETVEACDIQLSEGERRWLDLQTSTPQ